MGPTSRNIILSQETKFVLTYNNHFWLSLCSLTRWRVEEIILETHVKMFPPGPSWLSKEIVWKSALSSPFYFLIFAWRHSTLLQRIVYICCLQFFMSVLLFDSLQSGVYPHSCISQVKWAFSRCHFIWPVGGIALGTTPSILKHLFLWLQWVHILLIFSPSFSSWFFSATFGSSLFYPSLKCWSSGVWFRSSFLHTPHRWWVVLFTPMTSIGIYCRSVLNV